MHLSNLECITVETLMPFLVADATLDALPTVETLVPFLVADASLECITVEKLMPFLVPDASLECIVATVETLMRMHFLVADATLTRS